MPANSLFPKKIATDKAFCNRVAERQRLKTNIEQIEHVLLTSPRRFGKTSLVLQVIAENKYPCAYVDWFLAVDESIIIDRFLAGVAKAVAEIMPLTQKAMQLLKDFFTGFNLSLTYGNTKATLALRPSKESQMGEVLREGIEGYEALLKKQNKIGVLFIDEMQDIIATPSCSEIESTLRFYAQKSQHLAFIFSGSNRHLLNKLFEDKSKPLYRLCDRVTLERISAKDYETYIQKASKTEWGVKLDEGCLVEIFNLSQRHPYYLNLLCAELWRADKSPTATQVQNVWQNLCEEEQGNLVNEIENLTLMQKRILRYVAANKVLSSPSATDTLTALSISSRGIIQSIKGLVQKGLLEETDAGYQIIDPLLYTLLRQD